jgi:hypothetical protein
VKSLEDLKNKLIDGTITDSEIDALVACYNAKTRNLFWDIVALKTRGEWERAEKLQLKLNDLDKEEADMYGFLVYFLEFRNED